MENRAIKTLLICIVFLTQWSAISGQDNSLRIEIDKETGILKELGVTGIKFQFVKNRFIGFFFGAECPLRHSC